MSFTHICDEMSLGLKPKGGILAVLLVLFFAGTALAEDPGGSDLRGPQGPGWAKISESQIAIIAEELELGIDDDLISKGCRGCGRGGRRGLRGGHHHHGGRGHGVSIGPLINSLVRNLVAPTGLPPAIVQPGFPGIDYSIPNIPFDTDFGTGPARVPEATRSTPLHEDTPTARPSSNELLNQGTGLEQTASPPSTQETNQTPDQLLNQAQGLEQTGPPPKNHEETNSDPPGVQSFSDMAEQNTRKHVKENNNVALAILAAGGPSAQPQVTMTYEYSETRTSVEPALSWSDSSDTTKPPKWTDKWCNTRSELLDKTQSLFTFEYFLNEIDHTVEQMQDRDKNSARDLREFVSGAREYVNDLYENHNGEQRDNLRIPWEQRRQLNEALYRTGQRYRGEVKYTVVEPTCLGSRRLADVLGYKPTIKYGKDNQDKQPQFLRPLHEPKVTSQPPTSTSQPVTSVDPSKQTTPGDTPLPHWGGLTANELHERHDIDVPQRTGRKWRGDSGK